MIVQMAFSAPIQKMIQGHQLAASAASAVSTRHLLRSENTPSTYV